MKKFLVLLLLVTLLAGCSKPASNTELGEDPKNNENEQTTDNSSFKKFDDIYSEDLITALDYFNDNMDKFSDEEKLNFAKSLIKTLSTESEKYQTYIYEELPTAYAPMYPTLDSNLYDYYDFETKEFNIAYFKNEYEKYYKEFNELKNSKLFTMATEFWIDYGTINLPTFVTTLKSDIYIKFKPALDLVSEGYDEIYVSIPTKLYKDIDFSTEISDESILVKNFSQLKEFDGKETWKSTALMPVIFVEKEIINNSNDSNSANNNVDYGYENCVVKDIDYLEGGILTLKSEKFDGYKSDSFSESLAIFGTIEDATLSYQKLETESDKTEVKKFGTLTDTYLKLDRLDKGSIYWFDFIADGKKHCIALVDSEYENYVKDFAGSALTDRINFSDASNVSDPPPAGPKFETETINGEEINFNEHTAVIVPFYTGVNYDPDFGPLEDLDVSVSDNDKNMVSFAVFGKMTNVTITGIENMGDEGTSTHYDEITDKLVKVYCRLPNDMSTVKITGYIELEYEEQIVEFTLDDMRDTSEYKVLLFK